VEVMGIDPTTSTLRT